MARRSGLLSPFALRLRGALVDDGWFRSFRTIQSTDGKGRPVPWYTYPCRAFLERRVRPDMRVFEYGAGMSSLWYAERVAQVVSVEHDRAWAALVSGRAPANCTVVFRPSEQSYVEAIHDYAPFDIVVVDGLHRVSAAREAAKALRPGGVIIWDNSDWEDVEDGAAELREQGFRQIEFQGMGPINRQRWETSILYRAENCLGI